MSQMFVNKMGPPSRMLIRWVCPNQQMVTLQTRETTNGTTKYENQINKFVDQQDGPTTHIVVSSYHVSCCPESTKWGAPTVSIPWVRCASGNVLYRW